MQELILALAGLSLVLTSATWSLLLDESNVVTRGTIIFLFGTLDMPRHFLTWMVRCWGKNVDSDRWLDKVDETCLKQLQNVSKTFRPFHLATPPTVMESTRVGGRRRRFALLWRRPKAASIVVDGEPNVQITLKLMEACFKILQLFETRFIHFIRPFTIV